jgi:tight adherence protein C
MNNSQSLHILALLVVLPIVIYFSRILVDEYRDGISSAKRGLIAKGARKKRRDEIEREFPLIVELFAILIGGGMSPSTALAYICEEGEGEFLTHLRPIVERMREGMNLAQALDLLNGEFDSPIIRRFCDSLAISVERGTSLIDVVARQVEEVRSAQRLAITERANKAEISLMVPVVFLILPISILFALWPSYFALGKNFGGG